MSSPRHAALAAIMAKVKQGHAKRIGSKLPPPAGAATNGDEPMAADASGTSGSDDEMMRKLRASAGL